MVLNEEHNFDGVGRFRGVVKDPSHGSLPLSPCGLTIVRADSA